VLLGPAQRAWSDKLSAATNSGRVIAPGLAAAFGEQQASDVSAADRRISGEGRTCGSGVGQAEV
jgi:hypothetical protein